MGLFAVIGLPVLLPIVAILQLLFPGLLGERWRQYRVAISVLLTQSGVIFAQWAASRWLPRSRGWWTARRRALGRDGADSPDRRDRRERRALEAPARPCLEAVRKAGAAGICRVRGAGRRGARTGGVPARDARLAVRPDGRRDDRRHGRAAPPDREGPIGRRVARGVRHGVGLPLGDDAGGRRHRPVSGAAGRGRERGGRGRHRRLADLPGRCTCAPGASTRTTPARNRPRSSGRSIPPSARGA